MRRRRRPGRAPGLGRASTRFAGGQRRHGRRPGLAIRLPGARARGGGPPAAWGAQLRPRMKRAHAGAAGAGAGRPWFARLHPRRAGAARLAAGRSGWLKASQLHLAIEAHARRLRCARAHRLRPASACRRSSQPAASGALATAQILPSWPAVGPAFDGPAMTLSSSPDSDGLQQHQLQADRKSVV